MARLDVGKLAKILGYLGSPNDAEALAAARQAARLIAEAGTTWRASLQLPEADQTGPEVILHPELGQLLPPVGLRWVDTLRWLCARGADDRLSPEHRHAMQDVLRRLERSQELPDPGLAVWIVGLYGRIVGEYW